MHLPILLVAALALLTSATPISPRDDRFPPGKVQRTPIRFCTREKTIQNCPFISRTQQPFPDWDNAGGCWLKCFRQPQNGGKAKFNAECVSYDSVNSGGSPQFTPKRTPFSCSQWLETCRPPDRPQGASGQPEGEEADVGE
ncbi:MAG: hypothetical protein M1832_000433 [Thelocarpon impressellum]|nr:MAG: hypothetical protein M1832_000433 [Thelocarpon impressellum]